MDSQIVDQETREVLEEHTLNLLIKHKTATQFDSEQEVKKTFLADSFYHVQHQLKEGEITFKEEGKSFLVQIPNPSKDGRFIALRPTAYSFDRSAYSVDYGQLKFRGIPVATPGWEKTIPIDGVDLSYMHKYLEKRD